MRKVLRDNDLRCRCPLMIGLGKLAILHSQAGFVRPTAVLLFAELLDPDKDITIKVDFVLVDDRKFSSTQHPGYS